MSLKYLLIIFSLLLTSGSWCNLIEINNISLHNKLENYKWKKRILLLITKEEDTVLGNEVNKFFVSNKCKNDEKNLELIIFKKSNDYHKKRTSFYKVNTGIWLIGYDGNIKKYKQGNTLLLNLHNFIDNMSIRIVEMKE